MLLCDQTIVDAVTGKVSLIGTFNRFRLAQIPGETSQFTVFLELVDGIGQYEIVIEIQDLRTDCVLARGAAPALVFPERLTRLNVMIPVPRLTIKHDGRYDVVVLAHGQEIERQQFSAAGPQGDKHGQHTKEPKQA